MASERLEILITAVGGQAAASQITNIGTAATGTTSLLQFMRAALVAIASVEIVTRFAEMADVFTTVQNRLVLVTGSLKQANDVFGGLYAVAQQTRQPLEATTDVFTRIARSAEGQTLSFNTLLDVTRGLNETLLLSGAAGTRAKQGLIELSEGLGLGVLQGRQLRSLITDIPELANVIGKKVGVAGSQLFEFSQQNPGKLTPQVVIQSILEMLDELDARSARTGNTFGQVFTRFENSLSTFLGQLNAATGASSKLDQALQFISAHLGQIAAALAAFTAVVVFEVILGRVVALGAAFNGILAIGSNLVSVFAHLVAPVRLVAEAFGLMRLAILTNPLFLAGVGAVAAALAVFFVFHDQIMGIVNALGGLSGIWNIVVNGAVSAVDVIIKEFSRLPAALDDIGAKIKNNMKAVFEDAKHPFTATVNALNGTPTPGDQYLAANPAGTGAADQLAQDALAQFNKDFAARQATGTNPVNQGIDSVIEKVKSFYTTLTSIRAGYGGATNAGASGNDHPASTGTIADLDELKKKTEQLLSSISPLFAAQQKMADTAKAVGDAQRYFAGQSAFLDTELKGGAITAADYAKKMAEIAQQQAIVSTATETMALKVAGVTDNVSLYQQKFALLLDDLKKYPAQAEIINQQISKDSIAFLNTQTDAQSGVARTFLKMQADTADVAKGIESALTDAFGAANDAVIQFVTTGKVQITDLGNTIETGLLKQALTGLEGDLGAQLGFGTKQGGNGAIASIFNGVKNLIPGFGSSDKTASPGGNDLLSSMLSASALPASAGLPVFVTNAGALSGTGSLTGALPKLPGADSAGAGSSGTSWEDSIGGFFKDAGSSVWSGLKSAGGGLEDLAGSAASGAGSYISSLGTGIASLFGYASGGSFQVGASTSLASMNGTDNRLIAFRARDGETVSVNPPGSAGGAGGVQQTFVINTPDANSFRASQGQIASAGITGALRAARRNNVK